MTRPVDTSISRTLPFGSDAELRRRYSISHADIPANLRWGLLLEELDLVAEETALAYARRSHPTARVVTAAIDDIVLRTPVQMKDDLILSARINHVGRTSMEVGIRLDQPGSGKESLASCYFTMVARAGSGEAETSLPLEPLEYVDDMERMRYTLAMERRENYRQHQAALSAPPTPGEFELLARLHAAQDNPDFSGLLAGDMVRSSWERMYPAHENIPEKIFGGYLMRRAFELAHLHASSVAAHRPVVVRVNRINFMQPVRIGDELNFTSQITYTGRTSLSVEVRIERTSVDREVRAVSNSCVFTFANVDEQMRPRAVRQVYPTTYAEDARYLAGYRRHREHVVGDGVEVERAA
jgi:acyl-CoA hydrolase